MKVNSLVEAQYFADNLHRYLRKLGHAVPTHECYDILAWANKHKSWQALKPHLEDQDAKKAEVLAKMEKRLRQSFDAFLADMDFNGQHWQPSVKLKSFVEGYALSAEVSPSLLDDVNHLVSLFYKLDQLTDEKITDLLLNHNGYYFEFDPKGSLSFLNNNPPVSHDRRTRYALVFPSDLPEDKFVEDFKSTLTNKAYARMEKAILEQFKA